MNSAKRFAALLLLSLTVTSARCWAATVILKTSPDPLRGFVISEDERQLILRIPQADGRFSERTILKSDIDLIHRPVSDERLSALHPDRPKEYRDYAEELAEKRIDPEARELGLRLYAIAAYLNPAELGRSSLLGMTALAATAEEERRYRALAYILDPDHDRSVLKTVTSTASAKDDSEAASTNESLPGVLRALELLRKGRTQDAGVQLRREGIAEALAPYADIITYDQLLTECRSRVHRGPPASPELAAKLLQLELQIIGAGSSTESDATGQPWSRLSATALAKPVRPLGIETITEFDPRLCLYRDGKWVANE